MRFRLHCDPITRGPHRAARDLLRFIVTISTWTGVKMLVSRSPHPRARARVSQPRVVFHAARLLLSAHMCSRAVRVCKTYMFHRTQSLSAIKTLQCTEYTKSPRIELYISRVSATKYAHPLRARQRLMSGERTRSAPPHHNHL